MAKIEFKTKNCISWFSFRFAERVGSKAADAKNWKKPMSKRPMFVQKQPIFRRKWPMYPKPIPRLFPNSQTESQSKVYTSATFDPFVRAMNLVRPKIKHRPLWHRLLSIFGIGRFDIGQFRLNIDHFRLYLTKTRFLNHQDLPTRSYFSGYFDNTPTSKCPGFYESFLWVLGYES